MLCEGLSQMLLFLVFPGKYNITMIMNTKTFISFYFIANLKQLYKGMKQPASKK